MTDLRLTGGDVADLSIVAGDLATDDGLDNAVLISLFTDRRAEPGDQLPDAEDIDRRGWWGDEFGADAMGSRLWLLDRTKTTDGVLLVAQSYAQQALAWMVSEGVARNVTVETSAEAGALILNITIERVSGGRFSARYGYNWREKEILSGL